MTTALPPGSRVMFSGRWPSLMSRCAKKRVGDAGPAEVVEEDGAAVAGPVAVTASVATTAVARRPVRVRVVRGLVMSFLLCEVDERGAAM
ncbi:hypothetical protein GCM10010300_60260 [Streptomyces olivaceoviridis]|nr:hypothetical protein GCM10010300_60260 [Streptomyces olivaceoviridis]